MNNGLPPLVTLAQYGGDWDEYYNALYKVFQKDFIDSKPNFRGIKVLYKKYPLINNKEAAFWHVISEGDETNRVPDMRRCERISWIRPIIERSAEKGFAKCWTNTRRNEKRICVWVESAEYLVVLSSRKGYLLLWTAYWVTETYRKKKLEKEYRDYIKNRLQNANTAQ